MSGSQHTANAAQRITALAVVFISPSKRNGQKRPADKEQDKGLTHVFDDFANLFHSYSSLKVSQAIKIIKRDFLGAVPVFICKPAIRSYRAKLPRLG